MIRRPGWLILTLLLLLAPGLRPARAADAPAAPLAVALDQAHLPNSPGYHVIHFTARVGERQMALACGVFLPPAYFKSHDPLPIVVNLHCRGREGNDASDRPDDRVADEGLAVLLSRDSPPPVSGTQPKNPVHLRTEAQFIGLVPQCPTGYEWASAPIPRILDALIVEVAKAYHADLNRVYLAGFSYGASSVWQVALQIPERFAAIVPLAGRATADPPHDVLKLKDLGIYIAAGDADPEFTAQCQVMLAALKAAHHPNYSFHVIPGGNHWCYTAVYTDPALWTWLLAQHRGSGPSAPGAAAPTADAPPPPPGMVVLDQARLPNSPGYHVIHVTVHADGKTFAMSCGVFLPPAYFKGHDSLPIVMTLANNGREGTNASERPDDHLTDEGLAYLIARDTPPPLSGEQPKNPLHLRTDAQFIGLVPQGPPGYYAWIAPSLPHILDALIVEVAKAYHADLKRVYLTGFSYGGSCTWRVAMEIPDRFAAIAPLDARATPNPPQDVLKLKDLGIYMGEGGDDGAFIAEAQPMLAALKVAQHTNLVYRLVPGGNHWSYAAIYTDPAFWTWLLAQHRGPGPAQPAAPPPIADAPPPPPPGLVVLDQAHLPNSPGYHLIRATVHVDGKQMPLACGLFLPPAYFKGHDSLPIVMTLHNQGLEGSNGDLRLTFEGLAMLMARDHPDVRGTAPKPANPVNLRTEAQFIGLTPQCPQGYQWSAQPVPRILDALIVEIAAAYHADLRRVYLTGFSYGGSSTWRVALALPDRFAAIAPLDGRATPNPPQDVLKLKDLGIFLAVGSHDADPDFFAEAQTMLATLKAAQHANMQYRVIPGGNHWSYSAIYTDPAFWTWLLAQHRGAGVWTQRTPASAAAGAVTHATIASATIPASGGVLCQTWRDLPGGQVQDLTASPAYPHFPDEQVYLDQMEILPNQGPDLGTVLRAFLRPPRDGDYVLGIASDGPGELWLSADDQPEHAAKIAQVSSWTLPRDWARGPEQRSQPVHLRAGQRYYIEARHKKGGGGDSHLSVAWELPDGTVEAPIPALRLEPLPAITVPPPQVTLVSPQQWPSRPGSYRIKLEARGQGGSTTLQMLLVLPRDYDPGTKEPALVSFADSAQPPDAEGFRIPGPARNLAGDGKLAAWSPLILICPQCPAGQTWETLALRERRNLAAAVELILHDLPIDPARVYLTGAGWGGAAAWKLAALMPQRFAAAATLEATEVIEPHLPAALKGTAVRLVTGVADGAATECANRLKDALHALTPQPQVVYEMKMGPEVVGVHEARRDFYVWLLSRERLDTPDGKNQSPGFAASTPGVSGLPTSRTSPNQTSSNQTSPNQSPAADPWSDADKQAYFAAHWLPSGEQVRCMAAGVIRGHAVLVYRHYLVVTNRRVILWRRALGAQEIDGIAAADLSHGLVEARWRDDDGVTFTPTDSALPATGFRFYEPQAQAAAHRAITDLLTRYDAP